MHTLEVGLVSVSGFSSPKLSTALQQEALQITSMFMNWLPRVRFRTMCCASPSY